MNATQEATKALNDISDSNEPTQSVLDLSIFDLLEMSYEFSELVTQIQTLQSNNFFKHLSKDTRNTLLEKVSSDVESIKDLSRVVLSGLKKVKRERISDELLDQILSSK